MSMLACVISIHTGFMLPRVTRLPSCSASLCQSATLTPVGRHLSMSRSRAQVVSEAWINPGVHVLSILQGCSEQERSKEAGSAFETTLQGGAVQWPCVGMRQKRNSSWEAIRVCQVEPR